MPSAGEGDQLSYERDIKPLFRAKDRDSMLRALDLFDYDVVEHADAIVGSLRSGQMPCDGAWPAAQLDKLQHSGASIRPGPVQGTLLTTGQRDPLARLARPVVRFLPAAGLLVMAFTALLFFYSRRHTLVLTCAWSRNAVRYPGLAGLRLPSQPPMADIGRDGCRKPGSLMPWPGSLTATARAHRSAISWSLAPDRSGVRRSDSV
jgi:hypothetical protein